VYRRASAGNVHKLLQTEQQQQQELNQQQHVQDASHGVI